MGSIAYLRVAVFALHKSGIRAVRIVNRLEDLKASRKALLCNCVDVRITIVFSGRWQYRPALDLEGIDYSWLSVNWPRYMHHARVGSSVEISMNNVSYVASSISPFAPEELLKLSTD